jgi:uncharacterized membrane protein HdeD (DUF308 family)
MAANMAQSDTAQRKGAHDVANLGDQWWAIALRGLAGVVFGVLALLFPPAAVAALVMLFSAYALVDGIFTIVAAARGRHEVPRWGWLLFQGIVGVVTGVLAFLLPGLTAVALVLLIGSWSIIGGVAGIVSAIRLRKQIEGEWLLALSGVFSIIFGVLLFIAPIAGALALAMWIGAFAIVYGGLLIALGIRLRNWARSHQPQPVPTTAPVPRTV